MDEIGHTIPRLNVLPMGDRQRYSRGTQGDPDWNRTSKKKELTNGRQLKKQCTTIY